jgi:hypothetical protein
MFSRASSLALAAALGFFPAFALAQARKSPAASGPARVHELTLAQLRPGKSTLADADRLFGAHNRTRFDDRDTVVSYVSACWRSLQLDVDRSAARHTIQTITLRDLRLTDRHATDCASWDAPDRVAMGRRWRTSRGIALGSSRKQVLAAYGAPQSAGPGTLNGRALELLFYAFDWAGADVPQVMEITLEAGRVVQITLAFASL